MKDNELLTRTIEEALTNGGYDVEDVLAIAGAACATWEAARDDERAERIADVAADVSEALARLYEVCDDDEAQVGEVMYEIDKGARMDLARRTGVTANEGARAARKVEMDARRAKLAGDLGWI